MGTFIAIIGFGSAKVLHLVVEVYSLLLKFQEFQGCASKYVD
jgi:hypothetical protein